MTPRPRVVSGMRPTGRLHLGHLVGALDNWVTRGVSPETLTATDIAPATNGRSRPLCRYPLFPRYSGKGNVNLAASFTCAEP